MKATSSRCLVSTLDHAVFLSTTPYLCETQFSVGRYDKNKQVSPENQHGTESEDGAVQRDSKVWEVVWQRVYIPLVSNCGHLRIR